MKKALCRWLEEEGLEGHKKYNNTIMVVQEIALMANILKRFRAVCTFLRLCSTKDLKQLVLQLFAQRKREGSIANAEVSYSIWAGGRM